MNIICPFCGNDDQELLRENWHFTHAQHEAYNYQCYKCTQYFKIGPLLDCTCGWNKEEAEKQKLLGKIWTYGEYGWGYRYEILL